MDYESSDSRSKGCGNPAPVLNPFVKKWSSPTETPDFVIDDSWCEMVASNFGQGATAETTDFWIKTLKNVYKGDEGRKKVRMAVLCLLTRDGLLSRLGDIKCPVYWLQVSLVVHSTAVLLLFSYTIYIFTFPPQPLRPKLFPRWAHNRLSIYANSMVKGTEDGPYGITAPTEQIKLFTSSKEAKLTIIQGGAHYLSATSPTEVREALLELVCRYK